MERIRKIYKIFFTILLLLFFICSCYSPSSFAPKVPAKGVYHRVKKGETFWSIARAYGVNLQDLAEANNIKNPALIEDGSVIFIPDANAVIDNVMISAKTQEQEKMTPPPSDTKTSVISSQGPDTEKSAADLFQGREMKPARPAQEAEKTKKGQMATAGGFKASEMSPGQRSMREKPERKQKPKATSEEKEEIRLEKKRFSWPVAGSVKTRFGIQPNNTYHNWIKIVSASGGQVRAAAAGTVIFSSHLKDYGETIILRHEDSFATVYSHLKKRYVKTDQSVEKGDVIALFGEKDEAGDSYINFEVRLRGKARNPLFFLP